MKIDAHQHFWRYSTQEYDWISPDMAVLKQDCLPENLLPLLNTVGLEGTVAVQARQTLEETRWLLELAELYPFIKGIVGWVDLRDPELPAQLEEFCTHSSFCGVRHVVQDEADDEFMLREDFLEAIAALAYFGLTYDILIFPKHLPVACRVAERFPDQPFVLDHIAKPLIKDGLLEPWSQEIGRLAVFPNVYCKVSGMITEAHWQRWKAADFVPYLETVFEAFGPERIMFGSDWPVCTLAGTYAQVAEIVAGFVQSLSKDEQLAVWGETARRFYGLG
jgi:L-fuconolactonase